MKRTRRITPIRQLSDVECGPACVAMLLTYFGRHTTLRQLRERVVAGRDGLTVAALLHLAHEEGLTGHARRLDAQELHSLRLPALLHWRNRHFVLLETVSADGATIIDPAIGRRKLSLPEMTEGFSGTAVEFEPAQRFEPRIGTSDRQFRRYLHWLFTPTRARRFLVVAILASLLLQLFGLAVPAVTALLVDSTFEWRAYGPEIILAALASVTIARAAIAYLRGSIIARLQRLIDAHASVGFFDHLLRLPHGFFLQRTTGDLLLRLNSNMIVRELFTTQLVAACLDAPMALGFLGLLMVLAPQLALLAAASALLQMACTWFAMRRQRELAARALAAKAEEHGCAVETLGGIAYIKAVAAESPLLARWRTAFRRHQDVAFDTALFNTAIEAVLGGIRLATPIAALLVGMRAVDTGAMSLGEMLAATTLVTSFIQPVLTLLQSAQQLQLASAYMERVMDVLDTVPEIPVLETSVVAGTIGPSSASHTGGRHVECRDIGFRFGTSAPLVLQGISCCIRPGETLGVIGSTGSGKSTLAKILLGLWTPSQGMVLHNGAPLEEKGRYRLRARTGAVLQELDVFSGTILENIALGRPDATLDEVREVAAMACLDHEIRSMPLGYHTHIGDRGISLSGGQRQRLALARALLNRPDFLVLDEATSQLDGATERVVSERIRKLGCTRLIVSHRLSAVEDADWVLVMDRGRVVVEGRPRDVLRGQVFFDEPPRRAG